jgi:predicted phage baseplate assembly protein
VTAEDYEQLTKEAAPELARVRCVPAGSSGEVRILVVPSCDGDEFGRLRFEQLVPDDETLERVTRYLDERRVVGSRISVEPPTYQGITVVARIKPRTGSRRAEVEQAAIAALYRYYHPIIGGPQGTGWPFGRPIHVGEVYAVLQRLDSVEYIEDARLFGADPRTGDRGDVTQRLVIAPNTLVFSHEHLVRVDET